MITSILFFFVVAIGAGFLIDLLIKDWKADIVEKLVIRIGAGCLFIPIVGVIFNLLRIPIHWILFLVLSVVTFSLAVYFRRQSLLNDFKVLSKDLRSLNYKKYLYTVLVFLIFALTAYMYISGSFAYPWFENGDPYPYALSAKYIALENTFTAPYYFTHFAEPYPQGYTIFMGVMHQTNDSINFTLKFFNALIVSLSVLFFFYFARRFTKKESVAFWATVILAAIPAWLGHFIFALSFNMALMFIIFYALCSMSTNKQWRILAGLFYGAVIITHFYTAFVITLLIVIVYGLRILVSKVFSREYIDSMFIGLAVGLLFWIPAFIRHRGVFEEGAQLGGVYVFFPIIEKVMTSYLYGGLFFIALIVLVVLYSKNKLWFPYVKRVIRISSVPKWIYASILFILFLILILPAEKLIYAKGSASRVYTFGDFFIAQQGNMINNPIGIGWFVMCIFLLGILIILLNHKKLFSESNFPLLVSFTWVLFSFIGVMGASLSIGFVPFRMWTFFGMSLSLVTGYSIYWMLSLGSKVPKSKSWKIFVILLKVAFVLLTIALLFFTSFSQKYWHNTAQWPEHQVMVPESQELYVWIQDGGLPKDSMVTNICHRENLLLGYDMLSKPWLDEELQEHEGGYFITALNQSIEDNYNFLKRNQFQYVTIGASCIAKMKKSPEVVQKRIQEMMNSTQFEIVKATKSEYLFEVI